MKSTGINLVTAVVLAAFIAGVPVMASAASGASVQKKRSFGLREKGRGHIQLRAMIVPVLASRKSKRVRNTAVTVVLTIRDNFKVGKVCRRGPRITDALLRHWYNHPLPRDYLYQRKQRSGETKVDYRRTPAQAKLDKTLIRVVNKAVQMKKEVIGISVIKGTVKSGGGSVMKLPFSSVNGCDELQEKK